LIKAVGDQNIVDAGSWVFERCHHTLGQWAGHWAAG